MMDRQAQDEGVSPRPTGPCFEPHYTVQQLAETWNLSVDTVRKAIANQPGVLRLGHGEELHRRKYISIRVPQSVAEKIHRRLTTN